MKSRWVVAPTEPWPPFIAASDARRQRQYPTAIPNQLGVEYNAHALESILEHVAPELGWR